MTTQNRNRVGYEVLSSNLPYYLRVVENGNISLSGTIQLIDDRAPTWNTQSGNIARLIENQDDIHIELNADPGEYGTTVSYTVGPDFGRRGGSLPFGLTLNKETDVISGDVPRNMIQSGNPMPFYDDERPLWFTENENWELESKTSFSMTFNAESVVEGLSISYYVVDGALPFGLKLNNDTGLLEGELAVVLNNDGTEIPEVEPKPRWTTSPGRIAILGENEEFEFTFNARSLSDLPLNYYVVKGGLPFGTTLDKTTGVLKGDSAEVYYPDVPLLKDRNTPSFSSEAKLGTFYQGDEIDLAIDVSVFEGRSLRRLVLYPDGKTKTALPFGLKLTSDGRLVGKIYNGSKPGLYQFTIVAIDNTNSRSCNIFRMEVLEKEDEV